MVMFSRESDGGRGLVRGYGAQEKDAIHADTCGVKLTSVPEISSISSATPSSCSILVGCSFSSLHCSSLIIKPYCALSSLSLRFSES